MMNKGKDFFKTCFDTVAGLEVKNESQAIAKEVVLNEVEDLQQRIDKAIEILKLCNSQCSKEVLEILGGKE